MCNKTEYICKFISVENLENILDEYKRSKETKIYEEDIRAIFRVYGGRAIFNGSKEIEECWAECKFTEGSTLPVLKLN